MFDVVEDRFGDSKDVTAQGEPSESEHGGSLLLSRDSSRKPRTNFGSNINNAERLAEGKRSAGEAT